MKILVKNGNLVDFNSNCFIIRDILIDDEWIERIDRNLSPNLADKVIDARGLYVSPGFIDAHVHLREPGFEHKENILTGTQACAKGGFTHVFSMPNTSPSPDTVENLRYILSLIDQSAVIEVTPVASVTRQIAGKIENDLEKLALENIAGYSDDGHPVDDVKFVYDVLKNYQKTGKALMTHSEDLSTFTVGGVNRGKVSKKLGVDGIPNAAEFNMIERDIEILRQVGGHLHICHVSTRESIDLIRRAKLDGLNITCEVTPHHLSLTEDVVLEKGALAKVNPPLRTADDVLAIHEGLKDGTVDMIATDHAPHEMSSKKVDITKASYGFSGVEIAFNVAYTYLVKKERVINLIELMRLMSFNPAKIFGLDKEGRLEVGHYANLVLLDLSKKIEVDVESFASKGKNSPFNGATLFGEVVQTIYKGKSVFKEEK
jgi:dihydroorotase